MREKEAVISSKNEEIANMKNKMEDMAQEFGGMLKETLDKMRERIELSNSGGFDADSGVPIQRQMEEVGEGTNTTATRSSIVQHPS
mmetsp:Transcript_56573/g.156560  ORF Transcript_56573/g.156560 Transcript_56573/m.156560 type:complete len:86 (-) Transcript_56573:322-579(-)